MLKHHCQVKQPKDTKICYEIIELCCASVGETVTCSDCPLHPFKSFLVCHAVLHQNGVDFLNV